MGGILGSISLLSSVVLLQARVLVAFLHLHRYLATVKSFDSRFNLLLYGVRFLAESKNTSSTGSSGGLTLFLTQLLFSQLYYSLFLLHGRAILFLILFFSHSGLFYEFK